MASIYQGADRTTQKISRGQLLIAPLGTHGDEGLETAGNVIVERQIQVETADIKTVEDPFNPILARVNTSQNESLKLTCRSFTSLVSALAFMAPPGEIWTQLAITDGQATIPAGAKNGRIFDFVDEDGNQVFDVIVPLAVQAANNIIVDSAGGSFQVKGDRTAASTFAFSCSAVTASAKLGIFRRLQAGEIRVRARFRENNRFGRNNVHNWPIISVRASGSQKLSDDGNEVQMIELDGLVEYDNTAFGAERGTTRELNSVAGA
ncbi:ribosomal protein S11 [Methylorubrum extorquens]